jgi:uncharacterized protein (DUF1800 family)
MDPRSRMAHLLRRAGFGPAPGEVKARLEAGYERSVVELVEFQGVDDGLAELDHLVGGLLDFNQIEDVRTWWVYRMVHSRRPLLEKACLFWHGHFATGVGKVGSAPMMAQQNQVLREYGLGSFSELLLRVARDPAMLTYLDVAANKKAHPNENFSREVMELFTIGLGHYAEPDVREAARAFTGWGLKDGAFVFNPSDHDDGPKTFLGQTGKLDGSDVLRILAEHPATAERMCRKLFAFFAYPNPSNEALLPLQDAWRQSRGSIREVLRALFLSAGFSSVRAWRALIKSPAEFVIGSIRALGGTVTPRAVVPLMARMGQDLFNPPSVKGWDGGTAWISTSTLFERFNFAASLTTQRGGEGTSHVDPETLLRGVTPTSHAELLDRALEPLLDGDVAPSTRAALLAYLSTPDPDPKRPSASLPFAWDARMVDEKLRGLLHLILASPEYQLC